MKEALLFLAFIVLLTAITEPDRAGRWLAQALGAFENELHHKQPQPQEADHVERQQSPVNAIAGE